MSHGLNSLKGVYIGDYIGDYYGVIKGDTRSLDNGSNEDSKHSGPSLVHTAYTLKTDAP